MSPVEGRSKYFNGFCSHGCVALNKAGTFLVLCHGALLQIRKEIIKVSSERWFAIAPLRFH